MESMRNMITTSRLLIAALTLVVAFGATHVDPSIAGAQTTPLCPATIAPVKGGFGDAATLGLDDGVRRGEAAFEPGQLIVALRPGRTAKDLQCVADELRAVIIDGGAGRKGLGGIPNAIVLQLQPGISVERTASLLLEPRYRELILIAQPTAISEVVRADGQRDPAVDDPLFPVQWGVSNAGQVPKNIDSFPVPFSAADLLVNPFTSPKPSLRYSMRTRQAWGLLSRRALPALGPVRVAIVDDSLWPHPDLDANVAKDGNARYRGESGSVRIELLKRAGTANLSILDEWGVKRTLCPLSWDADTPAKQPDTTWIAAMVASQTNARCAKAQQPKTWGVTIDNAYKGSVVFAYDGRATRPVDLAPLWRTNEDDRLATLRSIEIAVAEALSPPPARPDVTRVSAVVRAPEAWDDPETLTRELRIVIYGGSAALTIQTAGLVSSPRSVAGISRSSADASTGHVGVRFGQGGSFRIRYALTVQDPLPLGTGVETVQFDTVAIPVDGASSMADAGAVQRVLEFALQSYVNSLAPNDPARSLVRGFAVKPVQGFPREYSVTTSRPVPDESWIVSEAYSVVDIQGIGAKPVTARVTTTAPRGALTQMPSGELVIDLNGIPALQSISARGGIATAGLRASADAVETIDAQTQWPNGLAPDDSHGQFIAGVIGATAGNGIGMAGVIGDQTVTKANIKLNGVVTSLGTGSLLSMLEYAESSLRAPVINFSIGGDATTKRPDLFNENVTSARRNDLLRQEDPMPIEPKNYLMGNVSDASRSLFVLAAGNSGADIRRPVASLAAIIDRNVDTWEVQQQAAANAPVSAAEREAFRKKLISALNAGTLPMPLIGLNPCRPKGMGITQRPVGIGSRASQKGGSLSMLQMPDGTFDRGNILCVASADWNGELSTFSNWGPGIVDVAAPGSNIVGTLPYNGYATENGTSFAAPMVAGVAAMVNSVLPNAQPWLVKCAILSSATSKPLRPADPTKLPFTYLTLPANGKERIPYPDESPLTVNGMVQASEAISAALYLDGRVRIAQNGSGSWPTCVQKRGFFGGWKNTPVLG
jgi:hypothetical protein